MALKRVVGVEQGCGKVETGPAATARRAELARGAARPQREVVAGGEEEGTGLSCWLARTREVDIVMATFELVNRRTKEKGKVRSTSTS